MSCSRLFCSTLCSLVLVSSTHAEEPLDLQNVMKDEAVRRHDYQEASLKGNGLLTKQMSATQKAERDKVIGKMIRGVGKVEFVATSKGGALEGRGVYRSSKKDVSVTIKVVE